MDRREAVLRELNLYPLWKKRGRPASAEAKQPVPEILQAARPEPDVTTSHSTRLSKDDSQVAGYVEGHEVEQHAYVLPATGAVIPIAVDASTPLTPNPSPAYGRGETNDLDWPELKQRVHDCTACRLRAGCTQTVFGVGDEKADWLFVGEGPGADEDALGEPFVGQAGKLLDSMLAAIKLERGKNVYIANVVKCRPPNNRTPQADEIMQCLPYLERQIALMQPKLIVALGKVAATALLGKDATIASLRGKLHDYNGVPLIVTYHPAYLLRSPLEKAKAWQDLRLATGAMVDKSK